jgi:CubicO group peptidase (beta-lactamase class C family)
MSSRRDFLKLAAFAACPGCASLPTSGKSWSSGELEALKAGASRHAARGWAAWQGSRQVASWRADASGPALSITKAIAALAAARAAEEGWLAADERVEDTISEWRADLWKSRITLRQLLQQTSGLEAGVIPLYRNQPPDKGRAAVALRCVDVPGSAFRYGPGHWELLAELMKRKLVRQNKTLPEFVNRSVMRPIGLSPQNWRSDDRGTPYFSTGTHLSIGELGRLGRTLGRLLAGDNCDGFSAARFAEMTRPSGANPMFGGGIWRNSNAMRPGAVVVEVERSIDPQLSASVWNRACISNVQSPNMAVLIGSGGRRVYLWPDSGRCIARLGSSLAWSDAAFLSGLR